MSAVVSSGCIANGSRAHVNGAPAAPVRRVAGLSPSAFFFPITHLRHFLYPPRQASNLELQTILHALLSETVEVLQMSFEKHDQGDQDGSAQ